MLAPTSINANSGVPETEDNALVFTGRFAGGLRDDIKRRAPFWCSDWTDAFTSENRSQALASVIFLFFACFSPAVTFGMLYNDLTEGQLGIMETILSTYVINQIVLVRFSMRLFLLRLSIFLSLQRHIRHHLFYLFRPASLYPWCDRSRVCLHCRFLEYL